MSIIFPMVLAIAAPAAAHQDWGYTVTFDDKAEPLCPSVLIIRDHDHGSKMDFDSAIKLCAERYKWSPTLQQIARDISEINTEALSAMDEAVRAGVTYEMQSNLFAGISTSDKLAMGNLQESTSKEREAAITRLARRMRLLRLTKPQNTALAIAMVFRAAAFTAVHNFRTAKARGD